MLTVILAAREQRAVVATILLAAVLLIGLAIFAIFAEQDLPTAPPPIVQLSDDGAPWRERVEQLPADHRNAGRHTWRARHTSGVRHA